MVPLLQLSRRTLPRPSRLKSLTHPPRSPSLHPHLLHWTTSSVAETRRSTVHDHLCRLLRSEIEYEMRTRPPREPMRELDSFVVEERPGEQWVRLTKLYGAEEEITVDATMFDGFVTKGEDSDAYGKLRISLVVDVKKGGKCNGVLQFLCSAWPDALVVKRISLLKHNSILSSPYMGPKFRDLDKEFREVILAFLQERAIDDDFACALHDYMSNKDRSEVIRWMENVKVFIEN